MILRMLRLYEIFGADDRAQGGLPPELEGKTPLEVAQYYQSRERERMHVPPPSPNMPPPPPPPVSADDFAADPLAAAQRLISQTSVSRAEYDRMAQSARQTLLASAKLVAKEGKKYWVRLLPQMEQIAQQSDPLDTLSAEWWTTTYNFCVGQNLNTLQSEDAERLRIQQSNEGSSGPPQPPPEPRALDSTELIVAAGLGMTQDDWRQAEQRKNDGRLPVTLDNRRSAA